MARHEGEFAAAAETSLEITELARALGCAGLQLDRERQAAIACLLSASEGWQGAAERLRGAFAEATEKTGLTGGKDK